MEAFRACSPIDPEVTVNKSGVILAFVHQATPDIRKKAAENRWICRKVIVQTSGSSS